jgi:hypothetical protein
MAHCSLETGLSPLKVGLRESNQVQDRQARSFHHSQLQENSGLCLNSNQVIHPRQALTDVHRARAFHNISGFTDPWSISC